MKKLLFSALLACGIPGLTALSPSLRAQEKDAKDKALMQPIPVVDLKRTTPVVYENEVEPILARKCAYCHSGNIKEGQLDLGTHAALMKGGRKGPSVVAGKSAESSLYKLSARTHKPFMPPKGEEPLTPGELALVKLWIDQGAKPPVTMKTRPKVVLNAPPPGYEPALALALSADGKLLASGRGDRLELWQLPEAKLEKTLIDDEITTKVKNKDGEEEKPTGAAHRGLVESVALSPDGKLVISGGFQEIAVWDRESGQIIRKVDGLADRVTCLAVSPDGKLLAAGGGAPTLEGEIKIYELPQLKRVADLPTAHSDTVYGLAFSADGKLLASAGADKFVRVWEVPSGKAVKGMEGHTHHAMDVSWKADGKLLASAGADNTVRVWTYETGEQARSITGHSNQVNRVMFVGATSQVASVAGDMTARIWNADNSQGVRTFSGAKGFLQSLAVSNDGKTLAAGGQDGKVLVFELATGKLLKTLPDDKFVEKPMPKPAEKPTPKPPEKDKPAPKPAEKKAKP